jgi:uncharacterized protein (TIGR03032 family)
MPQDDKPSTGETMPDAAATAAPSPGVPDDARTNISCSRGLIDWLLMNRVSLAFSSYQTGQLFLIGVLPDRSLSVHQRSFTRAMGVWCETDRVYVAAVDQVWRLENILARTERANQHFDRLYVPRNGQVTGDLDIHELAVDRNGRVVFVNTNFSCLAGFSTSHGFRPLWKPKFITKLAAEDRCHLNGLAMADGRPKYVTAVSRSDVLNGWRERRHAGGVIIEIETDRVVTDELSMPHSPRVVGDELLVLDSGRGYLSRVDRQTGKREQIAFCPGFLRGLTVWNGHAIVTVSLPRDGTFKGLELEDSIRAREGEPWCGIYIVNLRSGDIVQWIRLEGFIKELFDVGVLPEVQCPMAIGLGTPELAQMITYEATFGTL